MPKAIFQSLYSLKTKFLLEAVDASAGIHELLFAREVRMALGTNFDADIALGRAGLDNFAASAADRGLLIFRMDSFLHSEHLFSRVLNRLIYYITAFSKCKSFFKKTYGFSEKFCRIKKGFFIF